MAEESVDSVLTPEKHEDGVFVRESPPPCSVSPSRPITNAGNLRASYHAGDSSSKKSTERKTSSADRKNVVPHHLRASTGSCHDFCKHGKKHSFEVKERKPLRKKIAASLSNQHPVAIMVSGEREKEKALDQISPTDTEKHSPDLNPSPEIIPYSPKPKQSVNKKKAVKMEPSIDTKKNQSPPAKNTYSKKPGSTSSSGNKPVLLKSKPSSTKICPSPDPPEIVKNVCFPSKKDEDHPVKRASSADDKMPKAEKKTTFPSKRSSSSPAKPIPHKAKPFSSSSLDNSDSARGQERKNIVSKASAKKVLAPPKLPITRTSHSNSRTPGNVIIRSVDKTTTPDNEKVPEKPLHVIQTESDNDAIEPVSSLPAPPSVTSPSHDNSPVFPSHKEANDVTGHNKGEAKEYNVPEKKVAPIKTKVVISEDKKIHPPVKLKFRNGKVLEVQSNSYSPRRLRFRKARVIRSDEGRSDLRRRIFKKSAVNIGDKTGVGTSSEKIVLKHREVRQGKKDGHGLLNNVIIEQTASKLVKSRKSKVKALVGAFETVISLQEGKHSSKAVG